jgi:hypothetical protein
MRDWFSTYLGQKSDWVLPYCLESAELSTKGTRVVEAVSNL